jgi:hypothetical protein
VDFEFGAGGEVDCWTCSFAFSTATDDSLETETFWFSFGDNLVSRFVEFIVGANKMSTNKKSTTKLMRAVNIDT